MSAGSPKLAPHALDITAKIINKIKYLDGSLSLSVLVKTWEGGEPYYREVEVFVNYDDKANAGVTEVDRGTRG